ncbi:MAG TPA: translocation/assembly module TamB domain-containing protein [Gemmatimonadales bacterium]|nr:translocation/assembly module TamB domain-containing protein [Gemmatimonadales bacterium]
MAAARGGMGRHRAAQVLIVLGILVVSLLLLLQAPPVTRFAVHKLLPKINAQLNGRLTFSGIGGSLLSNLQLHGVTLRDPEGQVVLQAERVDVNYSVWDLLHSKFTLGPLLLERPIIRLLKDHPGEEYSILRVFAKETGSGKREAGSVDLTIHDVTVRDGAVVATIWRKPAEPQHEQAQQLDTVQLQNVNLSLPLLHYSAGPGLPRAALLEIATAQGYLVDPALELDQLQGEAHLQGDSLVIALRTIQLPSSKISVDAWLITAPDRRRYDATTHIDQLVAGDISSFVAGADIPADWSFRGVVRATSRSSGTIVVSAPDLDINAAGGTARGRMTIAGADNEWNARDSRIDVAGVQVERLLRAFHVPTNVRGRIDGTITADGRSGSLDLRIAGAAGYGVQGPVRGQIRADGALDALSFETTLGGALGDVVVSGQVATGKHLIVRGLRGTVRGLDLAALDARMPPSNLNGHFEGDVTFGSMPREATLRLFLDSSSIRRVPIDTVMLVARVVDGLLHTDTLYVRSPGLQVRGAGAFGLYEDQTGDLTLTLDAPSLSQVGPVVAAFENDSVAHFDGALRLDVTASGSLARYSLQAAAHAHAVTVKGLSIDSLDARAIGTPDSLRFGAMLAVDSVTTVSIGGRFGGRAVALDSLSVAVPDGRWLMARGSTLDSMVLGREPGPGRLAITRSKASSRISVVAEHVPVADLLRKGKRDSLPDLDANAAYVGGAASGHVVLTAGDRRPLTVDFTSNPLHGRLRADSLDLALFGPLVPSLRDVGGWLYGDLTVDGPTDAPRLDGRIDLAGGSASVPATNVKYRNAHASLVFSGATVTLDDAQIEAGKGRAQFTGTARFARLDRPELALAVKTDHFPVMNRHDFLEATATGELNLSGSPAGAVLTGNATVNEGNAYLDRFMHSKGIDLSDSLYAQFVDTTVLLQATGGRSVIESLMDSLKIRRITVDLGDHFWLKSPDAAIQLAGQLAVSTGNERSETESAAKYRLVGTVRAVRGFYNMTFAPGLTREFTIREGSIRYFGSPKTDAILDLGADHVVRTAQGDEVTIAAHIGGTMEKPIIQLTSDVSPPLSETELISYLVFGAPTAQAFLGDEGDNSQHQTVFEKGADQLVGVLSGKIENAVVSQLGLPIDYFRIKPGEVQSGLAGTELVLGMQVRVLGYPSFLRASPRFCPREQLLSLDHIGINLETRFTHQWGVATSIDPLQGCESVMSGTSARPYQFGVDLFWEKR